MYGGDIVKKNKTTKCFFILRGKTQRGKEETGWKPEHRVSKAQAPLPTQSSWEEPQEGPAHAYAHWWLTPLAWYHFTTRCQAGDKMAIATAVLTGECAPLTGVRARGQALPFRAAHTASVRPTLRPSSACLLRELQDVCNQDPLHS